MPRVQYLNQAHLNALFVKSNGRITFLGSCFYFVDKGNVMACTAAHCVRQSDGQFVIVSQDQEYGADLVLANDNNDVALLRPQAAPMGISMTLSPVTQKAPNIPLLTYEYSTTLVRENKFHLSPATRIGNCVRLVQLSDVFGAAGQDMLELSFPALRGASGAAVVELVGDALVAHGMIVANSEQHLLPAHIETVVDETNTVHEERKYFLPQAVAVNSVRIIETLRNFEATQ